MNRIVKWHEGLAQLLREEDRREQAVIVHLDEHQKLREGVVVARSITGEIEGVDLFDLELSGASLLLVMGDGRQIHGHIMQGKFVSSGAPEQT